MNNKVLLVILIFSNSISFAQLEVNRLLAAGVEDAQLFTESYFAPGLEAAAFSLTNAWFTSAKSKKLGQFEFSMIGNVSAVKENQQGFQLNTADYNFLQFQNGLPTQNVANVLGSNDPDIDAFVVFPTGGGTQQTVAFALPQGIASNGLEYVPTAFPQLSIGFLAGFELKFRYLPEINIDDATVKLQGIGVQNEISRWFPGLKSLPFYIGVAANYSQFSTDIQFDESPIVDSSNGTFRTEMTAWSYSGIVSTKWTIFNFYAGITYVDATTDFGFAGTFDINQGVNAGASVEDPFTSTTSIQGLRSTIGAKLSLAFFRIHIDYSFQEFDTLSAGLSFGI